MDLYDLAYVCGGGERVALVVLVGMCEDGLIKVTSARHRVTVLERETTDDLKADALKLIPDTGTQLGRLSASIAESEVVREIGRSLRKQGLTGRRHRKRAADDPRRVAVVGASAIEDAALRKIFETPDPDLAVPRIRSLKEGLSNDGYNTPDRSHDATGSI